MPSWSYHFKEANAYLRRRHGDAAIHEDQVLLACSSLCSAELQIDKMLMLLDVRCPDGDGVAVAADHHPPEQSFHAATHVELVREEGGVFRHVVPSSLAHLARMGQIGLLMAVVLAQVRMTGQTGEGCPGVCCLIGTQTFGLKICTGHNTEADHIQTPNLLDQDLHFLHSDIGVNFKTQANN